MGKIGERTKEWILEDPDEADPVLEPGPVAEPQRETVPAGA